MTKVLIMTTAQVQVKQKSRVLTAIIPTAVFLAVFIINLFIKINISITATQRMWLLAEVMLTIAAIVMLFKNRLPKPKYIIISAALALVMFIAYRGLNFSSVTCFISVFLCAMAAFSIFSRYAEKQIKLLKSVSAKGVIVTLVIALAVGAVLGTINLFLGEGNPVFKPDIICFLTALSPAIYEEVCFRFFTFAFMLYILKGSINTKGEAFFVYVFMIFPHAIMHTPDIFLSSGPINGIISALLLSLLFGLPFALLARKRDLTSAMVSHGLVDFIRFIFLGLPV